VAITASVLTADSGNTTGSSVDTASITPTANRLVLATVAMAFDGDPGSNVLSLSGNSLTWVRLLEQRYGAPRRTLGVFRALGASPTAGVVTISSSSAAAEQNAAWSLVEFAGVDTSGTNGSGAVDTPAAAATASGGAASLTLTITGTPATGDVTWAGFGGQDGMLTFASDALWVTLSTAPDSADVMVRVDWDEGQDQSPTWTWSSGQAAAAIGVILNVAPATGGRALVNAGLVDGGLLNAGLVA